MIKEVKYGGFSANPNDHEALEGDLAVAMNLIPEDGTVRPVLPPAKVFDIPNRARILCVHRTAAFHHYVCLDGTALKWLDKDGTEPPESFIRDFAGAEVIKVEPVGNTLVVLAVDGVHYILWKNGAYRYLGTHLPELDLRFELADAKEYESDTHKVEWDISGHPEIFDGPITPIWWFNSDEETAPGEETGKDVLARLRQGVMASLNGVVAEVTDDRRFAFPFFVRYAFRMYDGSLTMHSAPALMIPTLNTPRLDMGWSGVSEDRTKVGTPANIKATLTGYTLRGVPLDTAQVEDLMQWSDIIESVDVFVSPQFYTYDQGVKDKDITIETATPQPPRNTRLAAQVCDNGTFYLVKQARLSSSMPQHNRLLQEGGGDIVPDFEPTNDNIVTRELMSDDYGSHDGLIASKSFAFNGRVNLAGVSRRLFSGFNPACMWHRVGDTGTCETAATVTVDADGREVVLRSPVGTVRYAYRSSAVPWFFYPGADAKRAYLTIGGQDIELSLTQHPTLNGAYFCSLDEDAEQQTVASIPEASPETERVVSVPNKLYTSEINNPFFFPATGINTVGTGEIYGICAAVKALSQGQFGQFPLYAFTSEGVWALHTTDSGGFSAVQPVSRDVCINPESITQLDDAVLFATARGIMLISGSQTQCVSDAIDDKGHLVRIIGTDGGIIPSKLALLNGMGIMDEVGPFGIFLAECRMVYDYRGQRVIVYNPGYGYSYAYIYSLQSNKWGMMQSSIGYGIRSYPEALAVTKDGRLVDCSAGDTGAAAYQLLVTRPLALDNPDVLKTVDTVIQRGLFPRWGKDRESHVSQVLLGSRDLYRWHIVQSSGNEYLRGFSGSPYKWFRVALMLRLKPGESVTGCTIQLTPRHDNRPR